MESINNLPKILYLHCGDKTQSVLSDYLGCVYLLDSVGVPTEALRRLEETPCDAFVWEGVPDKALAEQFFRAAETAGVVCVAISEVRERCVHLEARLGARLLAQGKFDFEAFESLLNQFLERERTLQAKNDYIGTVSHELRTPLTIIEEAVAQVLDGIHGELNVDQRDTLDMSLESVHRLSRIVNDMLDISKIEAGKVVLQKEKTDLCELISDLQRTFAAAIEKRGLQFQVHVPEYPVELFVDKDKLTQVFTNLLSNAMKFTEEGSIDVYLSDLGESVECAVVDTGRGISADDLQGIFNRFEQCGKRSVDGQKGTGLGLAISKGLVELHRGALRVESALGKGSRFVFILPRISQQEAIKDVLIQQLRIAKSFDQAFSVLVYRCSQDSAKLARPAAELTQLLANQIGSALRVKVDAVYSDERCVYVVLPETSLQQAREVSERMQVHMASLGASLDSPLDEIFRKHIIAYPEVPEQSAFLQALFDPAAAGES